MQNPKDALYAEPQENFVCRTPEKHCMQDPTETLYAGPHTNIVCRTLEKHCMQDPKDALYAGPEGCGCQRWSTGQHRKRLCTVNGQPSFLTYLQAGSRQMQSARCSSEADVQEAWQGAHMSTSLPTCCRRCCPHGHSCWQSQQGDPCSRWINV